MASNSRWTLDYTGGVSSKPTATSVRDPPGYQPALAVSKTRNSSTALSKSTASQAELDSLRRQKAWELALAPAKNVPMQAFMMYMTGGGVQIFSVMSVWFLLKQAVMGIMSVDKTFAHLSSSATASKSNTNAAAVQQSYSQQKAVFVLCQIGLLGVGLWKCHSLGLLPTHDSDWLAFRPRDSWMDGAPVTSVQRDTWER